MLKNIFFIYSLHFFFNNFLTIKKIEIFFYEKLKDIYDHLYLLIILIENG